MLHGAAVLGVPVKATIKEVNFSLAEDMCVVYYHFAFVLLENGKDDFFPDVVMCSNELRNNYCDTNVK